MLDRYKMEEIGGYPTSFLVLSNIGRMFERVGRTVRRVCKRRGLKVHSDKKKVIRVLLEGVL